MQAFQGTAYGEAFWNHAGEDAGSHNYPPAGFQAQPPKGNNFPS